MDKMVQQLEITEEMVERYYELQKEAKKIDKQLNDLKKVFHQYFDLKVGENQKGELLFRKFKLQRNIRVSEKFHEEKTIEKLEKLNLLDCIKTIKEPDEEKINAAISLGIVDKSEFDDCKQRKTTSAILVKEI